LTSTPVRNYSAYEEWGKERQFTRTLHVLDVGATPEISALPVGDSELADGS
jgi:hypothetical protein